MASVGSSSASEPKGNAKSSNLAIWTCKPVNFCRGVLKLSKSTDDSQSALAAMPVGEHALCFATVVGYMEIHGSSGAKAYAKDQLLQSNHIFRWKHTEDAQDILARPDIL